MSAELVEVDQWLLNLGSAAVGGSFALGASWLTTIRQEKRDERALARQQSAEAAEKLLDLVDDASARFEKAYQHGSGPGQDDVRRFTRGLERRALLLTDKCARTNMERAARAFFHVDALEQMGHGTPFSIAYQIRREAHATLGAVVRQEPVVSSTQLATFDSDIADYYSHYAD